MRLCLKAPLSDTDFLDEQENDNNIPERIIDNKNFIGTKVTIIFKFFSSCYFLPPGRYIIPKLETKVSFN